MAADMQWATREQVDTLAKQVAKMEGQLGELDRQSTKTEVQLGELDKRLATKEDVEKAIGSTKEDMASVKTHLRWLTWVLSIGLSLLIAGVVQLLRMAGW